MSQEQEQPVHDVDVEVSSLAWESATPLFARYRVALTGGIDEAWIACYERASAASAEFSRFRLERETRTVSFTSKMSDGPAEVASVVRRLRLLVEFVNARAGCAPEPSWEGVARGSASAT